jgi:hypothetical protein
LRASRGKEYSLHQKKNPSTHFYVKLIHCLRWNINISFVRRRRIFEKCFFMYVKISALRCRKTSSLIAFLPPSSCFTARSSISQLHDLTNTWDRPLMHAKSAFIGFNPTRGNPPEAECSRRSVCIMGSCLNAGNRGIFHMLGGPGPGSGCFATKN